MRITFTLSTLLFGTNLVFAQIISTFAGGGSSFNDGVPAANSSVVPFRPIAKDASGNIYFAAQNLPVSGEIGICKVNSSGILTTFAGGGTSTSNGATALNTMVDAACHGMAVDAAGNVYYSEQSNHKVRKISASGIVTTVAGTGAMGFSGDGGAATSAKLNNPIGICIDASGNLFIADGNNHRIRKVTPAGIISTVAGNGTGGVGGENGPATSANMSVPESVITDSNGNLYFCDAGYRVCKISPSGTLTRIAGTGQIGFSGDGGPALSAQITPKAVAVDNFGNIYIADFLYGVVRRVDSNGNISTIAGMDGLFGYSGDGGNPLSAEIGYPYGLLVDAACNIYITCQVSGVIRKITGSNCYVGLKEITKQPVDVEVFPNPASIELQIKSAVSYKSAEITNCLGETMQKYGASNKIDISHLSIGLYLLKLYDEKGNLLCTQKFIKE